jgi:hypothetical protein
VPSDDSHAGRDAALGAGAVGAGGLAAHEYDSNRAGYTGIGQPTTTSHGMSAHELKEHEKHQHQREQDGSNLSSHIDGKHDHGNASHDEKKGSGILGGLLGGHKDKKEHNLEDQYAGRTDQRSAELHSDSTSHAGRNTALGVGALGAGGLAAHEYDNRSSPAGGSYPDTTSSSQNFSRPTGSSIDPYSTSSSGPTGSAIGSQYGQQGGSFATENPLSDHHPKPAGLGAATTGTALGAGSTSLDAYSTGQQSQGLSSSTTDPYSSSSQTQSTGTHVFGSKLRNDGPHHYGENASSQQQIAEGGNSSKRRTGYGSSSTFLTSTSTSKPLRDASDSEAYDPRNPNYGSSSAVGQTDGYGQRSDPTTGIEGTSVGTGNNTYSSNTSGLDRTASGKERSGVSKLLHREHPNKLHKEPPQGKGY